MLAKTIPHPHEEALHEKEVLILEDHKEIGMMLHIYLSYFAKKVSHVSHITEAQEHFTPSTSPDLLITDLSIKGDCSSTLHFLHHIKTLFPKTKILVYTGLFKDAILGSLTSQRLPFDSYVQKPSSLEELHREMFTLLD